MRKEIDGRYVAAQIRLLRQVRKGAILVVEGPSDAKVFRRFIDNSTCDIEVALGKLNVCEAMDLLEDEGFCGVVGVIDADFDRLTGTTYHLENLCVTDVHDLDLMIFLSPSLERYIEEYGDKARIEKQFPDLSTVRAKIIDCCLPLAYCRLVSECRNLRLRFSDVRHEVLVDKDTLTMDQDALIADILSRSAGICTPAILSRYIAIEKAKLHDPHQLARGHDVAAALGIALRKVLGDRRDVHTWPREVEAGLRLAFDWSAMVSTGLYQCLHAWEVANEPYRIFQH